MMPRRRAFRQEGRPAWAQSPPLRRPATTNKRPREQPLRHARHRVVEADPGGARAAAGSPSRAHPDRRAAAPAAARPRLAADLHQRRPALALGLQRRGARPRPAVPAAARGDELRPGARAARRGRRRRSRWRSSSSAPGSSRSPRSTASAACSTRRSSGCATASGWRARPARRSPSAAASAGASPTPRPKPRSRPRSPPRSSTGRSGGRKRTRATPARTRHARSPCSSRPGIDHIVLVTHGYHMPRALRAFTEAAAARDQGRAGADGPGAPDRVAGARVAAELARLQPDAPDAARAARQGGGA